MGTRWSMSKDVLKTIEAAFGDTAPPAPDELCATSGDEAFEDAEPFQGRHWRSMDPDVLEAHRDVLFWFTPEAFHYYLPSFLKAGLEQPGAVFVINLLQLLRPPDDRTLAAFRRRRWSRLSVEQGKALDDWLSWLMGQAKPGGILEGEIKQAQQAVRDRYWW